MTNVSWLHTGLFCLQIIKAKPIFILAFSILKFLEILLQKSSFYFTVLNLNQGKRYKCILLLCDVVFQKLGILIHPQFSWKPQTRWPLGNAGAGAKHMQLYLGISTWKGKKQQKGGSFIIVTNSDHDKPSVFHCNLTPLSQETEGGLESL